MDLTDIRSESAPQRSRHPLFSSAARTLLNRCFAVILLLAGTSAWAGEIWWNEHWTARKKVTVDTTKEGGTIGEPVGTSVVLLRLYEANYPTTAKEDLSDLRFVAADNKTVLTHHVEKVDSLMGEAFVWVKVPDVAANAKTDVWMYFGSNSPEATKAEDSKATYDADTVLVFHFGENGAPAIDATKNANTAENAGTKVEGSVIGTGVSFTGANGVKVPTSPSLLWVDGTPATVSLWAKATGPQDGVIFSRREGGKSLVIGVAKGAPYVEVSGQQAPATNLPMAPGAWTHLAVVCEAAKTTLFVNGEMAAAVPAGLPGMNSPLVIGGDANGAAGLIGEVDELQVHKIARPVGFLQLEARGQNGEAAERVVVVGPMAQPTNWLSWMESGHMGIILKSLTFDAKVVIVMLIMMAALSWWVMFAKVRYLNGLMKGNNIFMEEWRHVAADLTVLDHPEGSKTLGGRVNKANVKQMKQSSVYRIYHIGAEEIRHRLAVEDREGIESERRGLAGRSIQAIRASLDGGLVKESQRLNKLVVVLTICISGGPFLGLLGTVIGVMITFADVAAAGEVNVTAIAPGIAGALLATVAGLAVAIPALFGYNYILSRVKDAKDDMHMFIDEFVARMAEFYREKSVF